MSKPNIYVAVKAGADTVMDLSMGGDLDEVDFMTIHCGINRALQERLSRQKRIMGVVSRGGSFLMEWMSHHRKENPLYEWFDDLLAILKEHEVTLSLGDGIRPPVMPRTATRCRN